MFQNASSASLIHVADPMCSWCYAFGPELEKVIAGTGLDVRLVVGGLYVDARAIPLDAALRTYLRETWQRVAELSGQPIGFALTDWPNWTYDTGPACRAVVAMRTVAPRHALRYFDRLQQAFYAHNQDLTNPEVLRGLAERLAVERSQTDIDSDSDSDIDIDVDIDIDIERFASLLATETIAQADFAEARALGATGFPLLLLDTGEDRIPVSSGFNRADRILRTIEIVRQA